ncbi:hypothetical protein OS493_003421 [Desmophyllum pertusum]|uniref:Peptidase M12A domain-containing protein n=1 Tax=Desmophyllum pertusum TaxID=174260 RepID=A0A9X0DAV2_9CNID|nr:hypothetical protein OS493_003421 [Desmophyllum pertusum]
MKTILLLNLLWLVAVLASSPEENLNVETRGGEELFEGDMKFAPGQARGSVPGRLWPGGVFVYDIESSLSDEPNAMSAINNAMQDWKDNTCIKFRKRRVDETAYVSFLRVAGVGPMWEELAVYNNCRSPAAAGEKGLLFMKSVRF